MNALTNSIRHYLPTLKLLLICTELSLILCILDQETPWGLLRNLRQRLSPDCDPTYKASLRAAWRNLDRGLDKNKDLVFLMNALTNSIRHYLPTLKLLLICTELSLILGR
jgi:hypothetical protein